MGRGKRQGSPGRGAAPALAATAAPTRPASERPLLFVDVDGVLLADDGEPRLLASGATVRVAEGARLLAPLSARFDCVWASQWGEQANQDIAPLVGLEELEAVDLSDAWRLAGRRGRTWKLRDLARFAGERPLAWLDDQLGDDARRWAQEREERGLPTLLIEVDPVRGLGQGEIGRLASFLERLES